MPKSLSTRLLLAFAFVVVLTLAISAIGTLYLLRNQEQDAAEERVGRLAEPIAVMAALLERSGVEQEQIQSTLHGFADSFGVRILSVDANGNVVYDTDARLTGGHVDVAVESASVVKRGSAAFRMADFNTGEEDLVLFSSSRDSIELSANQLDQIQSFIYQSSVSVNQSDIGELQAMLTQLSSDANQPLTIPLPATRPLVAVPKAEIAAAWRDLLPQISIAGGIALVIAAIAAVLIARSVTGRLSRVTRAAQRMALGDYDQRVDFSSDDEVGRLAEAFNNMARQVSHSDQMMRDLLGNVSHELKTPLTSIQGFSQAMQEGTISSDEEYKAAGRIINEETARMAGLIEDLLELSRLESGQATVLHEAVDLRQVLESSAERVQRGLQERNPSIDLHVTKLPQIEGDGRRLEQVFTNLLENAVRHSENGCQVTVNAQSENGHVRVAVHNTGSYIPEEDLPRVFERFFQLDRNRAVSGTGLGLAIVHEVVQAHGGKVHAESARDTGTEFIVDLPVKPPSNGR